jgi:phosphomannomutase
MPRLFGTDGIRGVANVDLKPPIAYALGRATAHQLIGPGGALVIGGHRRSCDMPSPRSPLGIVSASTFIA